MKNLLIITTNYAGCECGAPQCNCIQNTGVYLEEFAVPYLVFQKSDINVTVQVRTAAFHLWMKNNVLFKSRRMG